MPPSISAQQHEQQDIEQCRERADGHT
jgi:hypothetical protein